MKTIENINKQTSSVHRFFRRSIWENIATVVIVLGIIMLMQPFSKWAFGYSFRVLLTGLILFTVGSHFPED